MTGGKDQKINIYTTGPGEMTLEKSIDIDGSFPKGLDYFNGKILAGLRNGNIIEIDEATEEKKIVLSSHHEGETWGLEIVPATKSIFTVGDDNKILQFNYETRTCENRGFLSEKSQPKNTKRAKEVTASTLSCYPPN